ncbi:Tim44 domain-containing protein [Ideonella sp. BN130291]|uniref:Tim44 domain-containing protein n=1 Tax=Ideonella sp. BN130291 TaxID=3112940 RepID=UPI002E271919|nr:Tim44-like domain-containing protein [Ideonella sp. BN130291]
MRQLLVGVLIAVLGASMLAPAADARRLGGGTTSGMKRTLPPPRTPQQTTPPQQQAQPGQQAAAPAAAPGVAGAAAAAPRRSWMGPIAGIAAGLGLAALFSHFGMGAGLANMVTILLIAALAFVAIRFLLRRFLPGRQLAGAAPGLQRAGVEPRMVEPTPRSFDSPAFGGAREVPPPANSVSLPPNFDVAGFERAAKLIFIRMQAANDAADLDDLRRFTTPEMFAAARLDLQDRQGRTQKTDVVQLNAEVMDLAREDGRDVVSVRYHGLIREDEGGTAQSFDEVWHLVRPADGSADWALAGIAQHA